MSVVFSQFHLHVLLDCWFTNENDQVNRFRFSQYSVIRFLWVHFDWGIFAVQCDSFSFGDFRSTVCFLLKKVKEILKEILEEILNSNYLNAVDFFQEWNTLIVPQSKADVTPCLQMKTTKSIVFGLHFRSTFQSMCVGFTVWFACFSWLLVPKTPCSQKKLNERKSEKFHKNIF